MCFIYFQVTFNNLWDQNSGIDSVVDHINKEIEIFKQVTLNDRIVEANNVKEVDDLLIQFSIVEHFFFKLYHQRVELLDHSNMSNHVLESSFLHIIKTFDVISEFYYDLFYRVNNLLCLAWCRLILILNCPYDLVVKHLLNVRLKESLLQQELDVSMIIIIANNQTCFH